MKPLSGDHRHKLLIPGDELRELKRHTGSMAEAFGLDRKIENYQGTRPITLYRWDLDCLLDVIGLALQDERDYPDKTAPDYQALKRLGERLHQEYDTVYGDENVAGLGEAGAKAKAISKSLSLKAPGQRAVTLKPPSKTPRKQTTVYQLKITLVDLQPSIWRRIEVEDCTLLKLHKIIQICMGWGNSHMWTFMIDGDEYGDDVMDSGGDREFASARKVKLSRFVQEGVERFHYVYDFGDNWEHIIQVEKVLEADSQVKYPRCVKGSRACPPEDCGGPSGYEEFLEAIADPEHEQHEEMLDWIGDDFEPEAFDIKAINKDLAAVR